MKRFTVRTLLIVTFLVAVLCALPLRRAYLQKQGRAWVALERGHVSFADKVDGPTSDSLLSMVSVDLFNPVKGIELDCEEVDDLGPVSTLLSLETLVINIELADGIDFTPLKDLPNLKQIYFSEWSRLTEKQLVELREMLPNVKVYSDLHRDE